MDITVKWKRGKFRKDLIAQFGSLSAAADALGVTRQRVYQLTSPTNVAGYENQALPSLSTLCRVALGMKIAPGAVLDRYVKATRRRARGEYPANLRGSA